MVVLLVSLHFCFFIFSYIIMTSISIDQRLHEESTQPLDELDQARCDIDKDVIFEDNSHGEFQQVNYLYIEEVMITLQKL